ncbi:NADH-quinone oxidoreductase subunit C [Candidatus Fermentibacterales bacterium]|nr:NADH-quinone oxidoreductase subunit C [Candidatus Fermentibacterales bacterium]
MMDDTLRQRLDSTFDSLRIVEKGTNNTSIAVGRNAVMSVLSFLKQSGYDHLHAISCVDWIDKGALELVWVLSRYMRPGEQYDPKHAENLLLRTMIPRDPARMVSSIPLFEVAEPYEREIHELFGVDFEGHPRLIPLFLERSYDTPPFRKDFDTRQYVEDFFESIPSIVEDGGEGE